MQGLSPGIVRKLEDRILRQRQNVQRLASARSRSAKRPPSDGDFGIFTVSDFKCWASVLALFNDDDFETKLHDDKIQILLRQQPPSIPQVDAYTNQSESDRIVFEKLSLPDQAPPSLRSSADTYAQRFISSRTSFERAARMSLRTVLNPGGWLTIRPITALNLPDTYNGMFVRIRYGATNLT